LPVGGPIGLQQARCGMQETQLFHALSQLALRLTPFPELRLREAKRLAKRPGNLPLKGSGEGQPDAEIHPDGHGRELER
jgi:hypothetical protein